jgi:hypothetical protein
MRVFAVAMLLVGAGCASSQELESRANARMVAANEAARAGDYQRAYDEQKKSEHDYQRAANRAYEEGRIPPDPPAPLPLPVFDPQLERKP